MKPAFADQAVRDRIRDDLATTLVVEAAAGTGKTSALVDRMVAALERGVAHLEQIVAVTFTDAAAGELKLRLRERIERRRQSDDCPAAATVKLDAALEKLEEARIGTIHSFCADLLRERPVEARVDPRFQIAPEDVARELFARVFERWFERQLEAPGEGVRRVLRRKMNRNDSPRTLLLDAAQKLVDWRDCPTPWRREPFARDEEIDEIMADLGVLAASALSLPAADFFTRSLLEVKKFVDEVAHRETDVARDYDGLEAELLELCKGQRGKHWRWKGWRTRPDETARNDLKARREAVKGRLDRFCERAGADLAPRLRDDLWPLVAEYEHLKERAGVLDFADLLVRARDLLAADRDVRAHYQRTCAHLFVDEFQDTDPLQAEILLLLAADDPAEADWRRVRPVPGKLFIVGDPKQSIYRFRRADVRLYQEVKELLLAAGAEVLQLSTSFRAVPAIQQAVNAAFAPRMTGTGAQADYVPLAPARPAHDAQPAVIALPVPRPYGDFGTVVNWKIDESLPDAVAALVAWLVRDSGWTVTERDAPDKRVPLMPHHVCLLFRRMRSWGDDVTRGYVRALEARDLRHVLVGGSSFHAREEILTLRNALSAIERPDDDLAVFATLRGPLFALDDGALFAYRSRFKSLHPFRTLPADLPAELAAVGEALAVLRRLHRGRNRRPFADTINQLLAATRAHAGIAIWPTGEQALANVSRLVDVARRAERGRDTSFRAFVERLEAEAEEGDASEAPILEEGTAGVRMMTVHRAKGLEFPVVILADLTTNLTSSEPGRYLDPGAHLCAQRIAGASPPELLQHRGEELARDEEEAVRVLYVAATRARDVLVVPAVADERFPGWLGPLAAAIYPTPDSARLPESEQPPGCPLLAGDPVVERPSNAARPEASVSPGLHVPEAGEHRIVWWSPHALELGKDENVGLRQHKLLTADASGARSDASIESHARWQETRAATRASGAVPTLRVLTATELAKASETPSTVTIESVEGRGERLGGQRFGTLVHAVLAVVDFAADAAAVGALAELQGRILRAPADEVAAAAEVVRAALAHPLLRRAASAETCRREVAVTHAQADGTLVEGVIDAAFLENGAWVVVDFKTDRELGERVEEYRRQVALYVEAVAAATGQPASGVLLTV